MQAAPRSPTGLQAVLGYVSVYSGRSDAQWTNTRALLLLLAESLLENSDTVQVVTERNREMFEWIEDNLRAGILQGEVRSDVDPALGAEFIVGAVRGPAQQHLSQGRLANLRRDKEQVMQLIEQAFAASSKQVSAPGASKVRPGGDVRQRAQKVVRAAVTAKRAAAHSLVVKYSSRTKMRRENFLRGSIRVLYFVLRCSSSACLSP